MYKASPTIFDERRTRCNCDSRSSRKETRTGESRKNGGITMLSVNVINEEWKVVEGFLINLL